MNPTSKKKLLLYSDCYVYGGSERLIDLIVNSAEVKEAYDVDFAYSNHRVYRQGIQKEHGKRMHEFYPLPIIPVSTINRIINEMKIGRLGKRALKLAIKIVDCTGFPFIYNLVIQVNLLKKLKPDLVHVNNGGFPGAESCSVMVYACRLCGIRKILYHVNNFAFPTRNILRKVYDYLISSWVNVFITASKDTRLALAKQRGFSLNKIKQLPNAIKKEEITVERDALLQSYSLENTVFMLCQVAFLSERKGQIQLLEALTIIKENNREIYDDLVLFLVGNGEDEKHLKEYAQKSGIAENVIFTGFRTDSINFINAADLFLLPSVSNEDMPLVILSAMSLGKEIISTNLAGIKEQIEHGVSGILLEPDRKSLPSGIADAIVDSYKNRGLQRYGENARHRYMNHFTVEVYGRNLKAIYDTV